MVPAPNTSLAAAHLAAAASHTAAATAAPSRASFNPVPFLAMIFGPIVTAIGNAISVPELVRTAITAFSSGGGFPGVLTAIRANLPAIWLDAGTIGIAEYVLDTAIDALNRHAQGLPIIPQVPVPAPAPNTVA